MSAELAFRAEREAHRPALPEPSPDDKDLLETLTRDGIVATTVERLGLTDIMAAAQPFADELLAVPTPADLPVTHLSPDRLAEAPEIFQWGLSDRILDLLEHYF